MSIRYIYELCLTFENVLQLCIARLQSQADLYLFVYQYFDFCSFYLICFRNFRKDPSSLIIPRYSCEALPWQINQLVDEGVCVGKGSNDLLPTPSSNIRNGREASDTETTAQG